MPDRTDAVNLLTGYRRSQCLGAAATLGLFDQLAAAPRTAAEAAETAAANPRFVYRLLRALAAMEVAVEDADGRFTLTPLGTYFTEDRLGPMARYMTETPGWPAWSRLADAIRTGRRGFDLEFGMRDWDYYVAHPDKGAQFDAAMRALTSPTAAPILAAHDFSGYRTVVDIGGGDGTLLIAILQANPGLRGILLDRPDVVARSVARLAEAGVDDRCETVGGSFFDAVPGGGDAYLMKFILHDWDDTDARRILAACRRSVERGTDLLVVERVLPERAGPDDMEAVMADVHMLVITGGMERTRADYEALLEAGGFRLESVAETGTPVSVLRAVAV